MVRWAPLHIPLERRLQTAAVVVAGALFPAFLTFLATALFYPPLVAAGSRTLLAIYVAWIAVFDRATPRHGGRPSAWVRNWYLWKLVAAYFPARLVIFSEGGALPPAAPPALDAPAPAAAAPAPVASSAVEAVPPAAAAAGAATTAAGQDAGGEGTPGGCIPSRPPPPLRRDKPHLFALHPHGVISVAAICNLVWNAASASERLGLGYRVATVSFNFLVPLWRELIMAMGFIDASASSVASVLASGKSVMIVVGGAAETLHARPGSVELVLRRRRGFVRLALQHGANLVPVFHFGENELYGQVQHPWLRRLQTAFLRVTGFTLPVIRGRGIFNYDVGIVPRRLPLTTVVGPAIDVPHIPHPTEDDITAVHTAYIAALEQLYNDNKDKYAHTTNYHGRPVVARPLTIVA